MLTAYSEPCINITAPIQDKKSTFIRPESNTDMLKILSKMLSVISKNFHQLCSYGIPIYYACIMLLS